VVPLVLFIRETREGAETLIEESRKPCGVKLYSLRMCEASDGLGPGRPIGVGRLKEGVGRGGTEGDEEDEEEGAKPTEEGIDLGRVGGSSEPPKEGS